MAKSKCTPEILEFIKANYFKIGQLGCAKALGTSATNVRSYASKMGLILSREQRIIFQRNGYKAINGPEKVSADTFTKIDTLEKSYICGLLYSDGWMSKTKIGITVLQTDAMNIEDCMMTTGKWNIIDNIWKSRSTQPLLTYDANNTKLVKLFEQYGYKTKSIDSPSLILKEIPENLHFMFWRGYFDGDGHCDTNRYVVSSSYDQDWSDLEALLYKLNIDYHKNKTINKNNQYRSSNITIPGRYNLYKLYTFLYPSSTNRIGFLRKHNQFIDAFNFKPKNIHHNRIKKENKFLLSLNFYKW